MNTAIATNFTAILSLPCCRLGVRSNAAGFLTALVFLPPDTPILRSTIAPDTINSIERALAAWLDNPGFVFELPLARSGTPFQQRTWQAISRIPTGEIRTYGELSADIGGTPRAVGQACGANPFPIIVPCHRVVAKSGLGGFANARDGWLLETKRWLLKHEGVL
ncbi:MAG: cysteine methyltransferase [Rhodocyclales bacterium]|nr:cysteine methyltransferase [Rhodocyclales bacterium]